MLPAGTDKQISTVSQIPPVPTSRDCTASFVTADGIFSEENSLWLREKIKENTVIYSHIPPRTKGWGFHSLSRKCTSRFFGVLDDFVDKVEASVGPYSADILAKDTGTGKYVVIENQLGKTDHDHLGKAITYGSVLDATAVVWIASEFTEEHQKALESVTMPSARCRSHRLTQDALIHRQKK